MSAAFDQSHLETKLYGISDLADEFQMTHRAIRLYEDKGLISPQRINGNRIYSARDRARLILIMRGKRLGFSLQEIGDYLDLYDLGDNQQTQNQLLITKVNERIAKLEQQRKDLDLTLEQLGQLRQTVLQNMKKLGS